jgi:hypothetical protein
MEQAAALGVRPAQLRMSRQHHGCHSGGFEVLAGHFIAPSSHIGPRSAVYLEAVPRLAKWRNRSLSLLRPVMNIHYGHCSFPDSFPDITLENSNKQSRPTMGSSTHCHR